MDEAEPSSVAGFFMKIKTHRHICRWVNAIIIKKFISDDIS